MMESLECPPLSRLTWEGDSWVASATLPSWASFLVRRGEDGTGDTAPVPNGTARLSLSPINSNDRTPPTAEQIAAVQHLLKHEAAVAAAVASALVDYCPGNAYDGDDEKLWNVNEPADLRPLVRLVGVHVLNVFRDGMACIGFEFDCAWDGEHGAGVMTHLGRVLATGQADCSFTEWIARQGLDRY